MPGKTTIFSMLVSNEFGVLTRITGLIRKEGLNIKDLAVAETENPAVSRLTICVELKGLAFDNIIRKLKKLECVRSFSVYSDKTHLIWELAIAAFREDPSLFLSGISHSLLYREDGVWYVELSGLPAQIDQVVQKHRNSILSIARSGAVTLRREGADKNA